jgi:hypothetical protein
MSPRARPEFVALFLGIVMGCANTSASKVAQSSATKQPRNTDVSAVGAASVSVPALTVNQARELLRNASGRPETLDGRLSITGHIVATNLVDAPQCAIHGPTQFDPEDCFPPVPSLWLGETPDAKKEDSIQVVGWASSFAQIVGAIEQYSRSDAPYIDIYWGQIVPNPIPVVGARVVALGVFGPTTSIPMRGGVSAMQRTSRRAGLSRKNDLHLNRKPAS